MEKNIPLITDLSNFSANELVEDLSLIQERTLIEEGLEHVDQGISIFDNHLRLVAANTRFCELLNFPPHFANHGTSLETMFRYNAERGEYGPGDIDEQVNSRLEKARKQEAHCFQRIKPDGMVLEIRGIPVDGFGFVTTYTDITQRISSTDYIRESKERFQDMARAASDWFWELDKHNRFTFLSERLYNAIGIPPQDLIGKTRQEIADPASLIEHRHRWQAYAEALQHQKPFRDFEYRFVGVREKPYYFKVSGVPVFDAKGQFTGYRGTGTDITALKEAEIALSQSAKRFRRLLDNSPAGAAIVGKENRDFLYINPRLAEMFQCEIDEITSQRPSYFYHDREHWQIIRERFIQNGAIKDEEVEFKQKDGSSLWALVTMQNTQFENQDSVLVWLYDVTELHNSREELTRLAQTDPLTGLANRRMFKTMVARALARVKRNGGTGALVYFDLDGFKQVNDENGHDIGDWILQQVAERVQQQLRATDILSRLGGDEFTVLLEDVTSPSHTNAVANKVLKALHEPFVLNACEYRIGASIGVTFFDKGASNVEQLIIEADKAMYKAKMNGRGQVQYYQPQA